MWKQSKILLSWKCYLGNLFEIRKRLNEDVEIVKGFCYLRNALNVSGGSEMTVVARTGVGWITF